MYLIEFNISYFKVRVLRIQDKRGQLLRKWNHRLKINNNKINNGITILKPKIPNLPSTLKNNRYNAKYK